MTGRTARPPRPWLVLAALACLSSGCRMVPRDQFEDCRRLSQVLRTENAQLKDQVLALRSQNQDLSDRSVDDVRRLAQLEEANRQLESSVQAYQDERARLESAYKELRASLPNSLQPLSLRREAGALDDPLEAPPAAPGTRGKPGHDTAGAWVPARPDRPAALDDRSPRRE